MNNSKMTAKNIVLSNVLVKSKSLASIINRQVCHPIFLKNCAIFITTFSTPPNSTHGRMKEIVSLFVFFTVGMHALSEHRDLGIVNSFDRYPTP